MTPTNAPMIPGTTSRSSTLGVSPPVRHGHNGYGMDVVILGLIHIGAGAFWVGSVYADEQQLLARIARESRQAGWLVLIGLAVAVVSMATASYWGVFL
jgi:hypothetical protein